MKSYDEILNDKIKANGWFDGTMTDWERTPDREEIAFKATGCLIAFPTWEAQVNCLHVDCQVRRGEVPPIAITNRCLQAELSNGCLRFAKNSKAGRAHLARLILAIRARARETGIYDPWKLPGGLFYLLAVMGRPAQDWRGRMIKQIEDRGERPPRGRRWDF